MKAPAPESEPIKSRAASGRNVGRRVPLAVWIGGGVVIFHALFFWMVWDKHFLPKVPPPPRVPPPDNFGAHETRRIDPSTGLTITERDFTVSTQLATPVSSPAAAHSP